MAKLGRWVLLLGLIAVVGYGALQTWRSKNVSAVQRGWRVAESKGCFSCHGPGGRQGMPDPGHGLGDVPDWLPGQMTMYASTEADLREWILDGMPKAVRDDPKQAQLRDKAVILMPAWRGLLTDRELGDLVAYIKAVSNFEKPQDEKAEEGLRVAAELGCFSCHGPQGRGSMPNARAFKGYIPSWDGADFPELAANDQEIREWIQDGVSQRFQKNPLARFFLERQPIKMPAYKDHISDAQQDRIVDFIHWLRQHPY